jgi:hypothetical protein
MRTNSSNVKIGLSMTMRNANSAELHASIATFSAKERL